jgi:hypothetical protein
MAPGLGLFVAGVVAAVALAIGLLVLLATLVSRACRYHGFARDSRDVGVSGLLAGVLAAVVAAAVMGLEREVVGFILFWFGGFLVPAAAAFLSLVTLILWIVWAHATRAGRPRSNGEWVLAVLALFAALAGPLALVILWALSKIA